MVNVEEIIFVQGFFKTDVNVLLIREAAAIVPFSFGLSRIISDYSPILHYYIITHIYIYVYICMYIYLFYRLRAQLQSTYTVAALAVDCLLFISHFFLLLYLLFFILLFHLLHFLLSFIYYYFFLVLKEKWKY